MTFDIDNQIPQDWIDSFQAFEKKHGQTVSTLYPTLANKTIEVKPLAANATKSDKINPIQVDTETDNIHYSANEINLTPDEREALIAHELGHLIHKGKFTKEESQKEEIECDKVAKSLGIGKSLKKALTKLRDAYTSQPDFPLLQLFYPDRVKEYLANIDERIDLL